MPASRNSRLGQLDAALVKLRRFWSRPEVRRYFARRLDGSIDADDYRSLRVVGRMPSPPSVGQVAAELRVDASTASRIMDRLVNVGLVRRTAAVEDRRRVTLELTDEGRDTLTQLNDIRIGFLRELTAEWLVEDIATLARLLERLDEACTDDLGNTDALAATAATRGRRHRR